MKGMIMTSSKKENITRRRFVKSAAGVTVCCACFPSLVFADSKTPSGDNNTEKMDLTDKEKLVAVCGTYCGACPMYINNQPMDKQKVKEMFERYAGAPMNMDLDNFVCDGCLAGGHLAFHCKNCKMRLCAEEKQGVTRCSDCSDFPCDRLKAFTSDEKPHHHELLDNLRNLKKRGIKGWTRYEDDRWTCPKCGTPLSWYDPACSNCGTKRSEKLFPLPVNE
jgi:hypothetical protein